MMRRGYQRRVFVKRKQNATAPHPALIPSRSAESVVAGIALHASYQGSSV